MQNDEYHPIDQNYPSNSSSSLEKLFRNIVHAVLLTLWNSSLSKAEAVN
jgi:hypothetical protein